MTARYFLLDIGSSLNINASLYLVAAHQKHKRKIPADHSKNLSKYRFNKALPNIVVKKVFLE